MRRILVMNQNHIGDALFSLPAIAAMRTAWPEAHIVNVAPHNVDVLFETCSHINERWQRDGMHPVKDIACMLQLRRGRFDAAFVFAPSSILLSWQCFLAGIPIRVGFDHPSTRWAFTHRVTPDRQGSHQAEDNLSLVHTVARFSARYPMQLTLAPHWIREAENVVAGSGLDSRRMVGLNPGASVLRKQWPDERWAALAQALSGFGVQPVFFGGPGDGPLIDRIQTHLRQPVPSLQGKLSLGPLAAAIAGTQVFVSGDTGPMHIAVAVGVPVVALHGPTNPHRTGPYTTRATIIHHPTGDGISSFGTMESIAVGEVHQAVENLLVNA